MGRIGFGVSFLVHIWIGFGYGIIDGCIGLSSAQASSFRRLRKG